MARRQQTARTEERRLAARPRGGARIGLDEVHETLGIPAAQFKIGSRDEPSCP